MNGTGGGVPGTEIMIALWGLLGGIIRALDTAVRDNSMPSIGALLANILIAGFCGFLAAKMAGRIDPDWSMVAAGTGGYLGTRTFDVLLLAFQSAREGGK